MMIANVASAKWNASRDELKVETSNKNKAVSIILMIQLYKQKVLMNKYLQAPVASLCFPQENCLCKLSGS